MGQPTAYNTALYMRLSKEDGLDGDSASIQTQKEMLTRYARDNGFMPYSLYVDDGFTGRNTERPDFQRMLTDIEDGKINCVIMKDLSRLGRNYLETGGFTEIYCPEHGVRFIAITDGVDTEHNSTMDITPFKNLLNDMYSQDISKKIRAAMLTRQKQGKFTGGMPPYAYVKDPDDKNHLIIDERYAPIVRRIFKMAKDGFGVKRIADTLSAEKIPRPGADEKYYWSANIEYGKNDCEWLPSGVRNILRNPVYKGANVGQRHSKISCKSKKRVPAAKRNPIIVEGCHEAIITPDEWELVQRIITSRKKTNKTGEARYNNIFSGLIKCADCGYSMIATRSNRKPKENPHENYDFYCDLNRTKGKKACSRHRIKASEVYDSVLADIQRLAKRAVKDDEKMVADLTKQLSKSDKENGKQAEHELKKLQKRMAELDKKFVKSYDEYVSGKLSERSYKTLLSAYEAEQSELESRVAELNKIVNSTREYGRNAAEFVEMMKEFANIDELTQATLNRVISQIDVHEAEIIDGESVTVIDVHYKFVGIID